MENIIKAVERAKGGAAADLHPQQPNPIVGHIPGQHHRDTSGDGSWGKDVKLNEAYLEAHRVISYDVADPRTKSFDMLRTPILQTMGTKSWQFLGITSPTPACGKTLVSVNLALSIARQQDRSVLLVDMDLRRPQVATSLGIKPKVGLMSVLEGQSPLSAAIVQAKIKNHKILVLPTEKSTASSSEWMASRQMGDVLQEIKRSFPNWTIILDLPPILTSDDVITILPQIDCVLFVASVGTTTLQEVKECYKHLDTTSIVRVVVNKAPDSAPTYYHARYAQIDLK